MDIYWIQDKRQCGPSTVPDVISLLQMDELTPDTLGWHAGCKGWVPLRELPALADFLNKPTAAAEEEPEAAEPLPEETESTPAPTACAACSPEATEANTAEAERDEASPGAEAEVMARRVYLPSPIARLLARFVDYGLYAVLYGFIVNLQGLPYNASLLLSVNPLLWLPMLALEAWMLTTWGTTPGKALMGIRVTTFGDFPRLSYLRALLRAFTVFTLGMGMMIPQLLPLLLIFQYWMLRRRGITIWDARSSTLPTQKEPASPSRYVLAIISLYISAVLFFGSMRPWLPGMIEEISRTNPEMATTLRELLPKEEATPATNAPAAPASTTAPAPQTPSLPGI